MRKSVGFNWGPAAVSTSYWTGVRLCDLLEHCGVRKPSQGARYVCFRGVQKELPQARPAVLAYPTRRARLAIVHTECAVCISIGIEQPQKLLLRLQKLRLQTPT